MSWKANLKKASFRGVLFNYEMVEQSGGRRLAEFEYPNRDIPATEDLGRKRKEFSIEAYFVGDDCVEKAKEFLEILEEGISGDFVHPTRETTKVSVKDYKTRDTNKDGRIIVFSVTFIETGKELFPNAAADLDAELLDKADNLRKAAKKKFLEGFNVAGFPQFLADNAALKLAQISDTVNGNLAFIKTSTQGIAQLGYTVRNLKAKAFDLINSPATLAENLISAVQGLGDISFDAKSAFAAYKKLFGKEDADSLQLPTKTTNTRKQEKINNDSLATMKRQVAIASAAEQAPQIQFASYEEAITTRDAIIGSIDSEIDEVEDDDTFIALSDLRAKMVQLVPSPDQDLPEIRTIRRKSTDPSLVIAYDLYESLDQEPDIVARNKVRHPGFVPGGKDLEVIGG